MAGLPIIGSVILLVITCATTAFWLTGGAVTLEFWQALAIGWGAVAPLLVLVGLFAWFET